MLSSVSRYLLFKAILGSTRVKCNCQYVEGNKNACQKDSGRVELRAIKTAGVAKW